MSTRSDERSELLSLIGLESAQNGKHWSDFDDKQCFHYGITRAFGPQLKPSFSEPEPAPHYAHRQRLQDFYGLVKDASPDSVQLLHPATLKKLRDHKATKMFTAVFKVDKGDTSVVIKLISIARPSSDKSSLPRLPSSAGKSGGLAVSELVESIIDSVCIASRPRLSLLAYSLSVRNA